MGFQREGVHMDPSVLAEGEQLPFFFFFNIYLFIFLCQVLVAARGIFVAACNSQLRHMGSSSLTRDGSQAPCIGSTES